MSSLSDVGTVIAGAVVVSSAVAGLFGVAASLLTKKNTFIKDHGFMGGLFLHSVAGSGASFGAGVGGTIWGLAGGLTGIVAQFGLHASPMAMETGAIIGYVAGVISGAVYGVKGVSGVLRKLSL